MDNDVTEMVCELCGRTLSKVEAIALPVTVESTITTCSALNRVGILFFRKLVCERCRTLLAMAMNRVAKDLHPDAE